MKLRNLFSFTFAAVGIWAQASEVAPCVQILSGNLVTQGVTPMKAVGYFKGQAITETESLLDLTVPTPEVRPMDLLVRVKAISVNPVDTKQRKRKHSEDGTPVILGYDVAGVVEKVGNAVHGFQAGDEVYYAGDITRPGGNSELHAVDFRIVGKKPRNLSFAQSAALPLTSLTAYEALVEHLQVKEDGTLLIIGGAGGVGSVAIQVAKLHGLKVAVTASRPETIAWVKELGADVVVDHREPLAAQLEANGISGVDYIFNTANTAQYWTQMASLIKPFGHITSIVESPEPLDLTALMVKSATFSWELMFTRSMFQTADMGEQGKILNAIAGWIESGQLRGTAAEVLHPINAENLKKAHAWIESGKAKGKIVLTDWE